MKDAEFEEARDDNSDYDEFEPANDDTTDDDAPSLPDAKALKDSMQKVLTRLESSFKSIRDGQASPELFDNILVEAYGDKVPLQSVAQTVMTSATLATIACFDPSVAKDVKTAVTNALNLNPQIEDKGMLTVKLPKMSAEVRQSVVKELKQHAESSRQRIRNLRRKAMAQVKKGKDGQLEGISKDEAFRSSKEVEAVTDEMLQKLNAILDAKEQSVLQV